jgi:hypothetical protein
MKTNSIFLSMLLGATVFTFSNCGGSKKEQAEDEHDHAAMEHASGSTAAVEAAEPQFKVDANFQKQLAGLFTAYVSLKNAFVSSDATKVKAEATSTQTALGKVDMKLLTGAAHNDWMNYQGGLASSLQAIQASDDIEVQRQAFSDLTGNLYKSIKAYGLGGQNAYYDFCPMAFDNQGAFWLSSEDKILNPYFGDKMLTCGVVKEKLK